MNAKKEEDIKAFGELVGDPDGLRKEVARLDEGCALVSALERLRVERGLSQRELAARAGISPSTLNRMEAGTDDQLTIGAVRRYLGGLGLSMHIMLDDESLPAAAKIKQSVIAIGHDLARLADLARQDPGDKELVEGIGRFRGEVLFNFLLRYMDTQSKISIAPDIRPGEEVFEEAESPLLHPV
ncbi:MAG: transcriptional regulator [Kiritimatiellae bacterium]|nr:transcriptional regulator [Kiritimatiellia bacterium]